MSTIKIKLNLVPGDPPGGILPRVRVSQNDNTDRILQFELYDGNAEADLSGISGAYIGGLKPDGNGFTVTCAISGNMATAILSVQSTVLAGDIPCKLYLIYEEGSVRSATFTMQVDPDPLNAADYSETEVPDIINFAREAAERAGESADAAALSESNAAASATAAANSATSAATSESNASASATAAANSATAAATSESNAAASETAAANSATAADDSATAAATSKENSEAYAIGERDGNPVGPTDPTYHNNARYYAEVAEQAAAGGLIPKGTILFADLPALADARVGDMWNIEDAFTTTSDFMEGPGIYYGPGNDIYKVASGKWDVLAGDSVTGVKGNAETDYRDGNVNITYANMGINQIATGGTGANTAAGARQNFFGEDLSSLVEYVIGITASWVKGGYLTLQQLRNKLGLGNTLGALPIANGGTGATTAANAAAQFRPSYFDVKNINPSNYSITNGQTTGAYNKSQQYTLTNNAVIVYRMMAYYYGGCNITLDGKIVAFLKNNNGGAVEIYGTLYANKDSIIKISVQKSESGSWANGASETNIAIYYKE